jgi:hypothetical protein
VDRKLKEKCPNIQIISIDSDGSVLANGDSSVGPYLVNNKLRRYNKNAGHHNN